MGKCSRSKLGGGFSSWATNIIMIPLLQCHLLFLLFGSTCVSVLHYVSISSSVVVVTLDPVPALGFMVMAGVAVSSSHSLSSLVELYAGDSGIKSSILPLVDIMPDGKKNLIQNISGNETDD